MFTRATSRILISAAPLRAATCGRRASHVPPMSRATSASFAMSPAADQISMAPVVVEPGDVGRDRQTVALRSAAIKVG